MKELKAKKIKATMYETVDGCRHDSLREATIENLQNGVGESNQRLSCEHAGWLIDNRVAFAKFLLGLPAEIDE